MMNEEKRARVESLYKRVYGEKSVIQAITDDQFNQVISIIDACFYESQRNTEIFKDYFGLNDLTRAPLKRKEIAEKNNISTCRVDAIVKKITRKLRRSNLKKINIPSFSIMSENARTEVIDLINEYDALTVKRNCVLWEMKSRGIDLLGIHADLETLIKPIAWVEGFGLRAEMILMHYGYNFFFELYFLTPEELKNMKGCGDATYGRIAGILRQYGFKNFANI